jgi:VanZ family protein
LSTRPTVRRLIATARGGHPPRRRRKHDDELMNERRPPWAWLFFAQLALVMGASVLATTGHLPTNLFQHSPFDKLGHLLLYGGLAFFAVAFFRHRLRWLVIICLLVLATLEELSQRALPRRTFDVGDLAMNIVGISAFGLAAVTAARFRGARSRRASTVSEGARQ